MNNPYQTTPMMSSYGSYGYNYNPQMYVPRYQQQETLQQNVGINGRVIQTVENINANEVPMDGSMAFFPKQDLTEIYVKGWNADGTIKTIVYKPYIEAKNDKATNLLSNAENSKFDLSDESTKLFMNKFDELFGKIEEIESKLGSQRKKSQNKESDSE